MKNTNYSVIVFFDDLPPKKWQYVHKLNGFAMFLDRSHPGWKYFNVYNRRTNQFVKQFRKGAFIPAFAD